MIVVDATQILPGFSGVRTRLLGLYQAYAALAEAPPVLLLLPSGLQLPAQVAAAFAAGSVSVRTFGSRASPWRRVLGRTRLQAPAAVKLWHTETIPSFAPRKVPESWTIHDLRWLRPRRVTGKSAVQACARRLYGRSVLRRKLERAAAVVTVSAATRDELHRHLRLPLDKIHVIENARAPGFVVTSDNFATEVRQRFQIRKPYFVSVGHLEKRKNWGLVIQALKALNADAACSVRWVLVGDGPEHDALQANVQQEGLGDTVKLLGSQDDDVVAALLHDAAALAAPSLVEGFCIPVAEAIQHGCPVLALDLPCFREWSGDGFARLQNDPEQWAKYLKELLHNNAKWREGARRQGEQNKDKTWRRSARQLAGLYRRLIAP